MRVCVGWIKESVHGLTTIHPDDQHSKFSSRSETRSAPVVAIFQVQYMILKDVAIWTAPIISSETLGQNSPLEMYEQHLRSNLSRALS